MKVEKTKPINVELMTGNKKGENKMEITEKKLCEYCSKVPNGKCNITRKCYKTCVCFVAENGEATPDYYTFNGVYTGKSPNRIWEVHDNIEEKEKDSMLPKNVKITNKNEDNIVYVNDCSKYPIKSDEEYVCIFDGNVINNNFVNINIYGIIIDINEKNIVVYNKENKNISIVDRKSIKCFLPKEEYNLIRGRD